jgi:hypothetical protein
LIVDYAAKEIFLTLQGAAAQTGRIAAGCNLWPAASGIARPPSAAFATRTSSPSSLPVSISSASRGSRWMAPQLARNTALAIGHCLRHPRWQLQTVGIRWCRS